MNEDNRPYKIPWPKDISKIILKAYARESYMIFSKKAGLASCTRCGAEIPLEKLQGIKHSSKNDDNYCRVQRRIQCPHCGTMALPKDMRYGRRNLEDIGRVTWMRSYGRVTFIETDFFRIDYTTPHPGVEIWPDQQLRLCAKSQDRWDWAENWWKKGEWRSYKQISLKAAPGVYGFSCVHDHLYNIDFGTDLQYANPDPERFGGRTWKNGFYGYYDEYTGISRLVRYLSDFLRYQAIEILEKSGFEKLVMNRAAGIKTWCLNIRAKDLRKILKVTGADVKALRAEEPSVAFMENLHTVRRHAPWAKVEDIKELSAIMDTYMREEKWELIRQYADISKLLRRILDETRTTGDTFTISDYADYLEAVVRLGERMDKRTIYPKRMVVAHDAVIAEVEEKKQSIDKKNFARFQEEITGMTEPFIAGGLLIRPARNPQELQNESRMLNHCVRTYADKVARGMTSILFIRKTEAPQVPYYTLELDRSGKVVQCRGNHNKSYPEEVARFIEEWKKWREKGRKTA